MTKGDKMFEDLGYFLDPTDTNENLNTYCYKRVKEIECKPTMHKPLNNVLPNKKAKYITEIIQILPIPDTDRYSWHKYTNFSINQWHQEELQAVIQKLKDLGQPVEELKKYYETKEEEE